MRTTFRLARLPSACIAGSSRVTSLMSPPKKRRAEYLIRFLKADSWASPLMVTLLRLRTDREA